MKSYMIAGVDEAGRGALIGNVVAAAVILPADITKYDARLLVDSKTLSEKLRNERAEYIKSIAVNYAIGVASPAEIDCLNIHHATLLAMRRAVLGLQKSAVVGQEICQDVCQEICQEIWVDGKFVPKIDIKATAFVKGDQLYPCISAASILAKTYRDAELIELAKKYPNYGFELHKGYPTAKHVAALQQFGILAEHRKSYKTIKNLL